jgi:23S rRNA pseudouridine1911/1915/1917 synthase
MNREPDANPSARDGAGEDVVVIVVAEGDGGRLDAYVARRTELSRTRVQALLSSGRVLVDDKLPRKSHQVSVGERIVVSIPAPEPAHVDAEDLPLDIVFEDPHLLVVNKAAGMVVHPAPGHWSGTLVNALLHHVKDLSGIGGTLRPGIVHRLDKDTSGLLVVAKEDSTHQALSEALQRREIKRLYRAVTWGHFREDDFVVDQPIGRDPLQRQRMAVVQDGRPAVTRVEVMARWTAADLLEVALGTGRTHQIRVHLSHLGHPVVGDSMYSAEWYRGIGGTVRGWARELNGRVKRQFLHASRLAFIHPATGERMHFEADFPEDLSAVVAWAESGAPNIDPE